MTDLLLELFDYQAWADSKIVAAVKAHPPAAQDPEILKTLQHMAAVHQFFVAQVEGRDYDLKLWQQAPASIEEVEKLFAEPTVEDFTRINLDAVLDRPPLDKKRPTARTALLQILFHSQHHRGQVASRLRALGGTPPTVDYILWKK